MMMMARDKDMDERLRKIMEFLGEFQDNVGYSPSIREIGDKIGVGSTSLVDFYLDKLEREKFISREKHISRSIRVLKPYPGAKGMAAAMAVQAVRDAVDEVFAIRILGPIGASREPIPMPDSSSGSYFDSETTVQIARSMISSRENAKDLFALQVQGESMIDAMVNDGDIIVMKPAQTANNGDMVAVWLDDENSTTLKYFYKESDHIRLQPANPTYKPIIIEKNRPLRIMAKVVMVIRQVSGSPLAA